MSRYRLITAGKYFFQTYKKPLIIGGGFSSCFCLGRQMMSSSRGSTDDVASRITRRNVECKEKNWREHYLNMSLEEKRKLYRCGKNYVLPSFVDDWETYAKNVRESYKRKTKYAAKYEVNEDFNQIVCLWRGDITKLEIDGIVNAANNSLLGGGGVDGAIHMSAGGKLREECLRLNGCPTGEAKITAGYNLPAKYIIHTVGPIGINPEKLRKCYLNSLDLAAANGVETIAFPCISTGIYGYDIESATPVVLKTVREWLSDVENRNKIKKIIFCVFSEKDVEVYEYNLLLYFPVKSDGSDPKGSAKRENTAKKGDKQGEDKATNKPDSKMKGSEKKAANKENGEESQNNVKVFGGKKSKGSDKNSNEVANGDKVTNKEKGNKDFESKPEEDQENVPSLKKPKKVKSDDEVGNDLAPVAKRPAFTPPDIQSENVTVPPAVL